MGAPRPMGKGKPLGPQQLIRDQGVGRGLGRSRVISAAPPVGTVALPARWLSSPRGGRADTRRGTVQPGFGKPQPITAHPTKPAGVRSLVSVPLPGVRSPSTRRAPACTRHPLHAGEPWFGLGHGRGTHRLRSPRSQPLRQFLRPGSSRLACHGELASSTLSPSHERLRGDGGKRRTGLGRMDGTERRGDVCGKARPRSPSQHWSFQRRNIAVPVSLCPFPP